MKHLNKFLAVLAGILVVFSPMKGMDEPSMDWMTTSQFHPSESEQLAENPDDWSKSTIFPSEEKKQSSPLLVTAPIKTLTASPAVAEIKPNQNILEAVRNKDQKYFDGNPDDLTKSVPYFINRAQDNDETKKEALNILDIIYTTKKCNPICQSAIKGYKYQIEAGYDVNPDNLLYEFDAKKFPRKSMFRDVSQASIMHPHTEESKEIQKVEQQQKEKKELAVLLKQQRSEFNKLKSENKKPSLDWLKQQEGILKRYIFILETSGYKQEKLSRYKKELENVQKAIKKDELKSSITSMTKDLQQYIENKKISEELSGSRLTEFRQHLKTLSIHQLTEYKNTLEELQKIDPQENRTELIVALDKKIESLQKKEESIQKYAAEIIPGIQREIEQKLPEIAARKFKEQEEQETLQKIKQINLPTEFPDLSALQKTGKIFDLETYKNFPDELSLTSLWTLAGSLEQSEPTLSEINLLRDIVNRVKHNQYSRDELESIKTKRIPNLINDLNNFASFKIMTESLNKELAKQGPIPGVLLDPQLYANFPDDASIYALTALSTYLKKSNVKKLKDYEDNFSKIVNLVQTRAPLTKREQMEYSILINKYLEEIKEILYPQESIVVPTTPIVPLQVDKTPATMPVPTTQMPTTFQHPAIEAKTPAARPVQPLPQPLTREEIQRRVDLEVQQEEQREGQPAPTQTWYDAITAGLTNMWQGITNFFSTIASTIRSWFTW
jgi:hypothetical protein